MRKEVLFAILIGCLVGLAVAFGLWRANKALRPDNGNVAEFNPVGASRDKTPQEKKVGTLLVTSPANFAVISENKVKVQGATWPNAQVIISTQDDETIVQSGGKGEFSEEIKLTAGANLIKVVAYSTDGNREEVSIAVVHTTELE